MQQDDPYISEKFFFRGYPKPNIFTGQILSGLAHDINPKLTVFFRNITFLLNRINFLLGIGNIYTVKLKKILNLSPADPMDATLRMHGITGLREAYAENLKIVLGHVAFLASKLSGNIIITSDHGEFLGEKRRFGHPCGSKDPILRIVPWFKITSVKRHFKYREISDIEYSI